MTWESSASIREKVRRNAHGALILTRNRNEIHGNMDNKKNNEKNEETKRKKKEEKRENKM